MLLEAALAEAAARKRLAANLEDEVAVPMSALQRLRLPHLDQRQDEPSKPRRGDANALEFVIMEAKLQVERKPLRHLIREDSIRLGLISKYGAEVLANGLAGRKGDQAEDEIVTELRNNLNKQVRQYVWSHKGGPWPAPKAQEDLRLDVVATRHIYSLLTLKPADTAGAPAVRVNSEKGRHA